MIKVNQIICGDALTIMKTWPDGFIDCCVTSPPYWGLRDYGVKGQLGLEPTPEEFIAKMVEIFAEVKRVLKPEGTLWLNMGDSYNNTSPGGRDPDRWPKQSRNDHNPHKKPLCSILKVKDLCGMPWRVAFALQQPRYTGTIKDEKDRVWMAAMVDGEGCFCGSEYETGGKIKTNVYISITNSNQNIIDNCERIFPQEVKHIYTKKEKVNMDVFRWDVEQIGIKKMFVQEVYPYLVAKRKQAILMWNFLVLQSGLASKKKGYLPAQKEKRHWLIKSLSLLNHGTDVDLPNWLAEPPSLYEDGYYLRQDIIWHKPNPMPESVRDRCTKAHEYIFLMSRHPKYYYDIDAIRVPQTESNDARPRMGQGPNTKYNQKRGSWNEHHNGPGRLEIGNKIEEKEDHPAGKNRRDVWTIPLAPYPQAHFATFPPALITPCILAGCPEGGLVLDPFMGSGTTAMVAYENNRNYIGCELNPEYIKLNRAEKVKKKYTLFEKENTDDPMAT